MHAPAEPPLRPDDLPGWRLRVEAANNELRAAILEHFLGRGSVPVDRLRIASTRNDRAKEGRDRAERLLRPRLSERTNSPQFAKPSSAEVRHDSAR